MLVKLDFINTGILSRALYWEDTVCKKHGTLEEPKGDQCGRRAGKSSKRKQRLEGIISFTAFSDKVESFDFV